MITDGIGELVVVRRPIYEHPAYRYLPCSLCYGFFLKETLTKHTKSCSQKPAGMEVRGCTSDALILLSPLCNTELDYASCILEGMRETNEYPGQQNDFFRKWNECTESILQWVSTCHYWLSFIFCILKVEHLGCIFVFHIWFCLPLSECLCPGVQPGWQLGAP